MAGSVHDVLTHLRSLFDASGIPSDDLENVAESLSQEQPVFVEQHPTLRAILEKGTDQVRFGLAHLFMLPWNIYEPAVERRMLIARDIRDMPIATVRSMPVSKFGAELDMEHAYILGGDETYTTIAYNDFAWTLLRGSGSENPGQIDDINDPEGMSLPADGTDLQAFIPAAFWDNPIFRQNSTQETHLLLRSFMEDAGLYKSRAVLSRNIRTYNTNGRAKESSSTHFGFGVRPLESEGWIPLLMTAPMVSMGNVAPGTLNPNVSPQIASEALRNIEIAFFAMKEMGVAMRSWNHVMVDPRTGAISLGEGDKPELLNATQLEWAMGDRDRFMNRIYSRDSRPHFPNLVVAGSGRNDLLRADRQLIEILKLLTARTGNPNPMIDQDLVVEQIVRDYELLAYFSKDLKFIESVADNDKRAAVTRIVDEYLNQFRTNGIVGFMTVAVPAIVGRTPFEQWIDKANEYMSEAFESGERSLEMYWARNAERIWGTKLTVRMKNGGTGSGSPTQSSPGGGQGTPAAGGTNSTPQAKAIIIDGFEAANETSNRPAQMQMSWAVEQVRQNPAMFTDMAIQTYPFNMMPISTAPITMAPMIIGANILLN